MSDELTITLIGLIGGVAGGMVTALMTIWRTRGDWHEARRAERQKQIVWVLTQLLEHFGEIERFLYLEDRGEVNEDASAIADYANHVARFESLVLSVGVEEPNNLLPMLRGQRMNNDDRGRVSSACRDIIRRLGRRPTFDVF